jgi:hypothetical protein
MEQGNELTHPPVSVSAAPDRLFQALQTKLTVGAANDKYEQEADRVADQVVQQEIHHARGRGQSLAPELQTQMGQAMGADFSDVRVHTDAQSDKLNQAIQAKAFTTGSGRSLQSHMDAIVSPAENNAGAVRSQHRNPE